MEKNRKKIIKGILIATLGISVIGSLQGFIMYAFRGNIEQQLSIIPLFIFMYGAFLLFLFKKYFRPY